MKIEIRSYNVADNYTATSLQHGAWHHCPLHVTVRSALYWNEAFIHASNKSSVLLSWQHLSHLFSCVTIKWCVVSFSFIIFMNFTAADPNVFIDHWYRLVLEVSWWPLTCRHFITPRHQLIVCGSVSWGVTGNLLCSLYKLSNLGVGWGGVRKTVPNCKLSGRHLPTSRLTPYRTQCRRIVTVHMLYCRNPIPHWVGDEEW